MSRATKPSYLIVMTNSRFIFSVLLFSCPVPCPDTEAGTLNYKPEREKDQPMRLHAQEYSDYDYIGFM